MKTDFRDLQKKPAEVFSKKAILKNSQYLQENTCVRVPEKETPTQVFSCEYCKILRAPILKNIYELLLLGLQDFEISHQTFTYSNSTIETLGKCVKYVKS